MSSSQNCSVLPQDVLFEILSRVPVKDLMRFKCVSKWWNHLVSDPTFVKLHLQRSSKNTHILLTFQGIINQKFELRLYALPCSVQKLVGNPSATVKSSRSHRFKLDYAVLGVCNGLVSLKDSYIGDEFSDHWVRFWNPSTRIMSEDSPRIRLHHGDYKGPLLYKFGFGYDDRSESYKVVVLDYKSEKMEVRVHCLGDNCWRNTLTCDVFPIPAVCRGAACVSGTMNWLGLAKSSSGYQKQELITVKDLEIFSYDLKNETCSYLSVPDGLSVAEVHFAQPALEVFKGCLCLSHQHEGQFDVWLRREFSDEKSWFKFLNLSHGSPEFSICGFSIYIAVLCVSENDDFVLLANQSDSEFILFNRTDNRIERRYNFKSANSYFYSNDYVESLVLPYRN
ncbi:unnamed protein product [Sphenostylis stenocarpa]|uniref:F-box domain-containing protein n=1 Tax=Sphenostylis stenocarpa TaxID=92480 RepID=A0AA86T9G5_9FABA|nr:unnamed protein product [Sphenostylis stenocarpa]